MCFRCWSSEACGKRFLRGPGRRCELCEAARQAGPRTLAGGSFLRFLKTLPLTFPENARPPRSDENDQQEPELATRGRIHVTEKIRGTEKEDGHLCSGDCCGHLERVCRTSGACS